MSLKVLCICAGGNVRSVAMAQFIKELNGIYRSDNKNLSYEAIAIGKVYTSDKTMKMLNEWANIIINMEDYIPFDIWGNPRDENLKKKVKKIWKQLGEEHH